MNDEIRFHEAANIFPLLDGDDMDEMIEDIRKYGLRDEIEMLDGQIIDGRNRSTACLRAGVERRFKDAPKSAHDDPIAYVVSKNLKRRQLTPSQRGLCAAEAAELRAKIEVRAKERMLAGKKSDPVENLPQGSSRDQIGKLFGVSGKMVDHGKVVAKNAEPEVKQAVKEGRMALSTAAVVARGTPEEQKQAAAGATRRYKPTPGGGDGKTSSSDTPRKPNLTPLAFQKIVTLINELWCLVDKPGLQVSIRNVKTKAGELREAVSRFV